MIRGLWFWKAIATVFPMTLVLSKAPLVLVLSATLADKKIIGSHGGLFPEEVVVGVSVLRKSVQRHPVSVFCLGEGKPKQSGEMEITIDNPNSVPLTNLFFIFRNYPLFKK